MRLSALPSLVLTVALVAGSLGMPAAAQAAIPRTACLTDGVAKADTALAVRLRPLMTGRRLGRSVTGYNITCARAIVHRVIDRGLPARAAVIAVTTAIAESTLHNYTRAVDHDSLGLFQQRPSMGWGSPEQLTDPGYATDAFLNKLIRAYPAHRWMVGDIGQISQRVQVSRYPDAYAPEVYDAQLIVGQLWTQPRAAAPRPLPKPSLPTPKPTPTGPFHKTLLQAGIGLPDPADDRHEVLVADWNGDRRPDLIIVQRSGTASGTTEVRVLDGASAFTHLLLVTGTGLGATDARHSFAVADVNADGRTDVVVVQKSGTASGRTEVRVLDGAANLQRYLQEAVTALGPTDARHSFAVADVNTDGRTDVVVVQKSGTASGRTEVRVLDGAANLQRYLQEAVTALGPTDARHTFAVADYNGDRTPDLVIMHPGGDSARTVLQVLDGAAQYRRHLLKAGSAPVATDQRHSLSVADCNADGRLDLVVVQKSGTVSGRTEAHILAG